MSIKVPISDKCPECKGQAYLLAGQAVSNAGEVYTRYAPYPVYEGSGRKTRWIELAEFATLLLVGMIAALFSTCCEVQPWTWHSKTPGRTLKK